MFEGTASQQKETDPSGVKASSETATNRRRATVGRASTNGYLVQLFLSPRGRGDEMEAAHGATVVEVSLSGGVLVQSHGDVSQGAATAANAAIRRDERKNKSLSLTERSQLVCGPFEVSSQCSFIDW